MATKEIGRGIGYNIGTDRGIVPSRFDIDFGELRRSVQSSQTPSDYYGTTGKRSTANGGVQQTVLVIDRGINIAQAERAVQKSAEVIKGRGGVDPTVERIPFRAYEGTETLYGKEAKEALRKVVETYGGKITKIVGDEVSYTYAIAESEVQRHKASKHSLTKMFESSAFREARSLSSRYAVEEAQKEQAQQEEKQRAEAEKARIKQEAEEETKARKFEEIERKEYYRHQNYLDKQIAKYETKKVLSGQTYSEILGDEKDLMSKDDLLANYKQIEKEDLAKREEAKSSEKETKDFKRSFSGKAKLIIGALLLVADVARRILSAVIKDSAERREAGITARSVGVTGTEVRNWGNVEKARNLKEETILRGVSAIETKFGDPRHLDTEALAEIAPYMPSNLLPLLQTGLAKENPKLAMEMIVNGAIAQVSKGLDWKNEYVGEEKARRSIVASVKRFDEDIGALFENMLDTNQYGVFAGQTGTFSQWESAGRDVFTNLTAGQIAKYEELAQVTAQLSAQFTSLKNDALAGFALALSGLLNKINQWDIGKSPTEKLNDKLEAKQRNQEASEKMQKGIDQAEQIFSGRAKEIGIDFSSLGIKGVSNASEFFDFVNKDSHKAYDVIKKNAKLQTFMTDPQILMLAQMQQAMKQRKSKADEQLAKKNISDMTYDQLAYTDASIAEAVASSFGSGAIRNKSGVVFQNWFKDSFLGDNYVSGGYSMEDVLSSESAQKYAKVAGIDLSYSPINTVQKMVEAGNESGSAKTRAWYAMENLANLIEQRGGGKVNRRGWFGIPLSNEDFAKNIEEALAKNPSLLSENDIFKASTNIRGGKTNISGEDMLAIKQAFLEDMRKEQEQAIMQLIAISKSGSLQSQLASLQKQGVDVGSSSLTLSTVSKDERDVTFVIEAEYNGRKYQSEGGTGKFESSSGRGGYKFRIPIDLSQMQ